MKMSFTTTAAALALLGSLGFANAQSAGQPPVPPAGDVGVSGAIQRGPSTTGCGKPIGARDGADAIHRSGGPTDRPTSTLPNASDSRGASPNAQVMRSGSA